jgi:Holliday junction resolvase RusA-like endonuclease
MEQTELFPADHQVLKFIIPGNPPSKSNAYKIISTFIKGGGRGPGSLAKTKALIEYEKKFFMCMNPNYRNLELDHYFKIEGNVYYPSNRSDLDNSLKIILDCLQRVTKTIKNDNKCVEIHFHRAVDTANPRIEIKLTIFKNL